MIVKTELLPHQMKVLQSESYLTSMSCGIGAGKSYMAAFMAIYWMLKGRRVLVIMPTFAMIRDTLILQMIEILNNWKIPYTLNKTLCTINIGKGIMFTRSGENIDTINSLTQIGAVIMDECRLIPEMAYTYAISRQRGVKNAKCYLFGTGCSKRAWFARESLLPDTAWIKASCVDNVKYNGQEYVDRVIAKYKGQEDYFIQRELYGDFVDGDEQSLFIDIKTNASPNVTGKRFGGMDLAINGGSDYSSAAIFDGNKLIYLGKRKTLGMPAVQQWKNELQIKYACDNWVHDHTGLGNDLELKGSTPILFGMPGVPPYGSKRTELYYALREKLMSGIYIESDDIKKLFAVEVIPELEATKTIDKEGRNILLIPKDEIRRLLGRSPDASDALALAAWNARNIDDETDWGKLKQMQFTANPYRAV